MRINKALKFFTLTLAISLFFVSVKADAEVFEYRHIEGARYRILSIVNQSVFINGELSHSAETLNRIAVDVIDVKDGKARHNAIFQSSERIIYDSQDKTKNNVSAGFNWLREYESVFERDKRGYLTIDPMYYMPVVRNVPIFPSKDLKIGEKWNADAHEVHDFRDSFGIQQPYKIPFRAFYEYLGEREWKGKNYPAFSVNYNIESRPSPVRGRLYPVRISGTFRQNVFWDRAAGMEKAYNEEFRITFEMSNRMVIEFRGTAEAEFVESEEMNKEKLVAEITEEIKRLEIPEVSVREVEEGVSISLDDIKFYADLDKMLPGEEKKLERITEILKRYGERDIVVSGHTALAGTADERMTLSQQRARVVADYLLSKNVRTADRMVIRGYGALRPVADNNTEEGMRKNRRVEITILEN
jgi:outer membrane protein OmpA-like peptidoglycan-associated protein